MAYLVVEFIKTKEVAVVSHKLVLSDGLVAWPLLRGARLKHLLKTHTMPEEGMYTTLSVRVMKATGEPYFQLISLSDS
jgi:hypothetical protein